MVCLEEIFLVTCVFSKKKVHSLSIAPEPLAIWNKELEGLEFELFKELKTSSVAAPERISRFFYSKRTQIQGLSIFSGSLLLPDVVVWWSCCFIRCRIAP